MSVECALGHPKEPGQKCLTCFPPPGRGKPESDDEWEERRAQPPEPKRGRSNASFELRNADAVWRALQLS